MQATGPRALITGVTGREPTVTFPDLVRTMVEADLAEREREPVGAGSEPLG